MRDGRDIRRIETQRVADTRYGTVRERNADGTYLVEMLSSKQLVRASKANPLDEYTSGTRVVLNQMGASGLAVGGGYVIVSRAPQEMKGLAAEARVNVQDLFSPTVLGVDPHPVQLMPGGDSAVQEVAGVGLRAAPSYESPDIENDEPPVVTSRRITSVLRAAEGATPGLYDLTVQGRTVEDAVEILEPEEEEPEEPELPFIDYLFAGGHTTAFPNQTTRILKIQRQDEEANLPILATYTGLTGDANDEAPRIGGMVTVGDYVYAIQRANGPLRSWIVRALRDAGSGPLDAFAITPEHSLLSELRWNGSKLVAVRADYTSGTKQYLVAIDRETFAESAIATVEDIGGFGAPYTALHWDGANYWTVGSGRLLRRITPAGVVTTAAAATGVAIAEQGGYIYVAKESTLEILKVDKATLDVLDTLTVGVSPKGLVVVGGYLYAVASQAAANDHLYKIDPATFAVVAHIDFGESGQRRQVVTDGEALYVVDGGFVGKTVYKIDLATFTAVAATFASDGHPTPNVTL